MVEGWETIAGKMEDESCRVRLRRQTTLVQTGLNLDKRSPVLEQKQIINFTGRAKLNNDSCSIKNELKDITKQ